MVGDFIDRKHGNIAGPIDYLHPSLEPVLKPTYGVILYQEQVMQIAQVLAGYTLGGADLLRRAMGKKKPEEMAKQRSIFVAGAVKRGCPEAVAAHIFDLMEKFAGYGFNKSHSAAYALLSYQTAYLKAHHPAAFMAAVLSADMDHTDKVVPLIKECADIGLTIRPPDVNASSHAFTVADERTIRYGLGAVRGVGQNAVDVLVAERTRSGPYQSLEDLCRRIDLSRVNRRVLEALLKSGSLDGLGENRATLSDRLGAAMQLGDQASKASQAGQDDLFGLAAASTAAAAPVRGASLPEWPESVRLAGERETLGLYLTGHPIGRFEPSLAQLVSHRIGDLLSLDRPGGDTPRFGGGRSVTVAGLVDEVKKKGQRVFVVLDDRTGRIELSLFDDVYQRCRELLIKDALVLVEGQLRFDEFSDSWRVSAKSIRDLDQLRESQARRLLLSWPDHLAPARLAEVLGPWRGGPCPVSVQYTTSSGATGRLMLGRDWKVRASLELLTHLEGLVGREAVQVFYGGAERDNPAESHAGY
jgi:DNA polymerase-3 subunit alpha